MPIYVSHIKMERKMKNEKQRLPDRRSITRPDEGIVTNVTPLYCTLGHYTTPTDFHRQFLVIISILHLLVTWLIRMVRIDPR